MRAVGRRTEASRYPRVICDEESREAHGSHKTKDSNSNIPVQIHPESATPQCVQPLSFVRDWTRECKSRGQQTIIKIMH